MGIDFNPNDITELNDLVSGKTIASVSSDRAGMNDHLIFEFTDGSVLEIEYDYIYEYDLKFTQPKPKAAP